MSPYSCINLLSGDASSSFPWWGELIIVVILLFVCGIFSGSENIFSSCNKYHFKVLKEKNKTIGKVVDFLIEHFDETLITVLIVNNTIQYVMSYLMSDIVANWLISLNVLDEGTQSLVATLIMSFLIYIFTDSLFKILGKHLPNKLAQAFGYIVFFFYIILFPITKIFSLILLLVHKIFRIKDKNILTKEEFIKEADNAINIEEDDKEELLEPNELKILNKAFTFDTISANKVLKKREDIFAINIDGLTNVELNKIILSTNYSRIPVYEDDIDNIIGILSVRKYFEEYSQDEHLEIRGILLKPLFFKKEDKVDYIFEEFNKTKNHMGIILDENGKTYGMVTMDDILEELVGDIDEIKINKLKEVKNESKSN